MDNVPVHTNHGVPTNRGEQIHTNGPDKKNKRKKVRAKTVIVSAVVVALIAIVVVVALFFYRASTGGTIDTGKYQAVFFTNGQVYFGKLQTLNDSYMKLTDVFYLQTKATESNPQATASETAADVQLVKLGDEVHGPEDAMIISKDQVLFFENLKKDGKVSASIDQYHGKQ